MFSIRTVGSFAILLVIVAGCSTAPKTQSGKSDMRAAAEQTIAEFKQRDPSLQGFFGNSAGYAVFPTVGKGGLIVGGARGRGVLYEGGRVVGYCAISEASIGAQIGGESFSEVIFFENPVVLNDFKTGSFDFSAQVHAVAAKEEAGKQTKYQDGVAVFTLMKGGLMAAASVAGQKFSFDPE